ncbi:MAG: hypothetical protein MZU97_09435 [Bacillus subtilis]|nr:hypothetical protein [Bacillus subtilis]
MLPDASSLAADRRGDAEGRGDPRGERGRRGLQHRHAASACSPAPTRSNMGFFFVQLKPWEERHDARSCMPTASSTP